MRRLFKGVLILGLLGIGFIILGYWNATRDPIVRRASITVADWPADTTPFRVLLISDIHVAGPDMPPARLTKIIGKLNALKPDMVAIAGDLISDKRLATSLYTPRQIADVLAQLKSPQGTIVALGNHDNWVDAPAFTRELSAKGITVLENQAVRRGPFIVGGMGDHYSKHDDIDGTFAAMDALDAGTQIVLTHSPDIIPQMPRKVSAVLAGHTHCGQIALPFYGPIITMSDYGDRFGCGDITDQGQRIFVGAGLGTSGIWLRYSAPPDVWMITFRPQQSAQP